MVAKSKGTDVDVVSERQVVKAPPSVICLQNSVREEFI
jgi:hypothetical protein